MIYKLLWEECHNDCDLKTISPSVELIISFYSSNHVKFRKDPSAFINKRPPYLRKNHPFLEPKPTKTYKYLPVEWPLWHPVVFSLATASLSVSDGLFIQGNRGDFEGAKTPAASAAARLHYVIQINDNRRSPPLYCHRASHIALSLWKSIVVMEA